MSVISPSRVLYLHHIREALAAQPGGEQQGPRPPPAAAKGPADCVEGSGGNRGGQLVPSTATGRREGRNPYSAVRVVNCADAYHDWSRSSDPVNPHPSYLGAVSPNCGMSNVSKNIVASSNYEPHMRMDYWPGYNESSLSIHHHGFSTGHDGMGTKCPSVVMSNSYCVDNYYVSEPAPESNMNAMQHGTFLHMLPSSITDTWQRQMGTNHDKHINPHLFFVMGAEQSQQQQEEERYTASLCVPRGQRGQTETDYAMGLSSSLRTIPPPEIPRFMMVLPPPLEYDKAVVVLTQGNGLATKDLVHDMLFVWRQKIEKYRIYFTIGRGNCGNMSDIGKKTTSGLKRWCPEAPLRERASDYAVREWAIKCDEWWNEEFFKHFTCGKRRTGAVTGGGGNYSFFRGCSYGR